MAALQGAPITARNKTTHRWKTQLHMRVYSLNAIPGGRGEKRLMIAPPLSRRGLTQVLEATWGVERAIMHLRHYVVL